MGGRKRSIGQNTVVKDWRNRTESLQLVIRPDDRPLQVALMQTGTGRTWGPVALLSLDVFDKPLKRIERIANWEVAHTEPIEDGGRTSVSARSYAKTRSAADEPGRHGGRPSSMADNGPTRRRRGLGFVPAT